MNTRQISILGDLALTKDYITSQELAFKYGVSPKTIYADLSIINNELTPFAAQVKRVPRHGIYLQLEDAENRNISEFLENIKRQRLDGRVPFQREYLLLKKLILEDGRLDILDWSLECFISEASVRRDLDRLEKQLTPYSINLRKKGGKVYLEAREEDIRRFLRNYMLDRFKITLESLLKNSSLNLLFPEGRLAEMVNIVKQCSNIYRFKIAEQYQIYLILDLLISAHRYLNGHSIKDQLSVTPTKDLQHYEVYIFAGDLLARSTGLKMNQLPDVEIKYLSYSLLAVGYEADISDYDDTKKIVRAFILKVSELAGIDFSQDGYLLRMLVNHINPMIYRLKNGINISNQTTEEIKKKYSILYHMVWLASKILSKNYEIDIFDAEIAFLTIYFEISVEKQARPLLIYVICPHGLATSQLIMNSLRRLISNFDHLLKIDMDDLTAQKIEEADLIISSIQLENASSKYIFVSPIVTDKELETIQHAYSNLTRGNRHLLSAISNNKTFVASLIHDLLHDAIFLQQSCHSVSECLHFLIEKSAAANRSNDLFGQSIFSRERLGSTSIYTGIALPHADPAYVKQSQLLMLSLKKPLQWGSNMVKLVILIAIAEKDEELYKDALISLYSKIDNKDYIDDLCFAKNKEELLQKL